MVLCWRYFLKKVILFSLVFSVFLLLALPGYSEDKIVVALYVEGNKLYVGGSGPENFSQIQEAIDASTPGDHIFVFSYSSPYLERININKALTIQGENQTTTVIDGENSGDVVTIVADDCQFYGFTVRFCGGTWSTAGVRVLSNNNKIYNNIITQARNGIFAESTANNTFSDNRIVLNGYHGIRVEFSSEIIIRNNTVSSNDGNGMYLWETKNSILSENIIANNQQNGIMLGAYCTNNQLYHNNFLSNQLSNAYDPNGNSWDDGYPSGGNYWDDYEGNDTDNDSIGDVPYVVAEGNTQDQYPLMYPYPTKEPYCLILIQGGFGLTIDLHDTRKNGSDDLDFEITNSYLYLFRSEQLVEESGTIPTQGHRQIHLSNPRLLSVGSFTVSVWAGNIHEQVTGIFLGPVCVLNS